MSVDTPYFGRKNIVNAILMHSVAVPIVFLGFHVIFDCSAEGLVPITLPLAESLSTVTSLSELTCRVGLFHPIAFVNIVMFFLICVLFWMISLVQKSTWLIDPYWTIIPPLIASFYHFHPMAQGEHNRATFSFWLTMLWSVRLTHSYFRRENFRFGAREDWRFQDMRTQNPKNFWWQSFFLAYLSQHVLLVGITLPLWAINFNRGPDFGAVDIISLTGCAIGLMISNVADRQLRIFMVSNMNKTKKGLDKVLVLKTGLWKYSRHPNYFGEQIWWWSLALLGRIVGNRWTVIGAFLNTASLTYVTHLTERRIKLSSPERAKEYRAYAKLTNMWLIFWPDVESSEEESARKKLKKAE